MRPGVSIMFKVNPALVREHIIGLRPSDCIETTYIRMHSHTSRTQNRGTNRNMARDKRDTWKALTLATLSPTMELTVDDLPTPPFPITRIVNVLTF
jgi:hypothetical protein